MSDQEQEKAARSAEIFARVTGSTGAYYTIERVEWINGERHVISTTSAVYRRKDEA